MSTDTHGNVKTEEDRVVHATRMLYEALGLSVSKAQMKLLTIALAETSSEEIRHDPTFAARLKTRFESLLPPPIEKKAPAKKSPPKKTDSQPKQKLIPVKHIEADRLNPYGIPDPAALLEAFGEAQLPLALNAYSLSLLSKIAAGIQKSNPASQPADRRQKGAVVDYIVQHVVRHR